MSEEKKDETATNEAENNIASEVTTNSVSEKSEDKFLDITVNKAANELVLKDPETGKEVRFFAKVTQIEDSDEEEAETPPLTSDDFNTALQRIDSLGLTWSADTIAGLRPKQGVNDDVLISKEFDQIRKDYPNLPQEVAATVFYVLTGKKPSEEIIGSEDDLEKKTEVVRESVITDEYRAEFFFKHAIKVPYLTDIDWEVVLKLREKNVEEIPGICYAILSLVFHNPTVATHSANRRETLTVAVNDVLVNKLIKILIDVKDQLEFGRKATSKANTQSLVKGETDATENKQLE